MQENSGNSHEKKPSNSIMRTLFEWLEIIVVSVIAVVVLLTFAFKVVTINGPSMLDTLHSGDKVIISSLFYSAKRGDVVVISRNYENAFSGENIEEPIIKRVIATEGQTVNIDFEKGIVYVDGEALNEPYTRTPTNLSEGVVFPVTVPENCVFVLGDNRNDSTDSRDPNIGDEGMIDERYIMGKAIIRVFPFDSIGVIK